MEVAPWGVGFDHPVKTCHNVGMHPFAKAALWVAGISLAGIALIVASVAGIIFVAAWSLYSVLTGF